MKLLMCFQLLWVSEGETFPWLKLNSVLVDDEIRLDKLSGKKIVYSSD